MITYEFLQQYWWFLISLLGGLLVSLLFVQGGNALIFLAGKTEEERQLLVNSTGRKWELTFTTLVTFGGAFFASFPLFYMNNVWFSPHYAKRNRTFRESPVNFNCGQGCFLTTVSVIPVGTGVPDGPFRPGTALAPSISIYFIQE